MIHRHVEGDAGYTADCFWVEKLPERIRLDLSGSFSAYSEAKIGNCGRQSLRVLGKNEFFLNERRGPSCVSERERVLLDKYSQNIARFSGEHEWHRHKQKFAWILH